MNLPARLLPSKYHIIVEGPDNSGKSTLVQRLVEMAPYDERASVKHFSKPKSKEEAKESYYAWLGFMRVSDRTIADRAFYGEAVYAPLYRGYYPEYLPDLDEQFSKLENAALIVLAPDAGWSKKVWDGVELNGGEFQDAELIRLLFLRVAKKSKAPWLVVNTEMFEPEALARRVAAWMMQDKEARI